MPVECFPSISFGKILGSQDGGQIEREKKTTTLKGFCNLWGANLLRIDFSKTLDKISHEVLVHKMEKCGMADRIGFEDGYTTVSGMFSPTVLSFYL